jgi:hypothetical protein
MRWRLSTGMRELIAASGRLFGTTCAPQARHFIVHMRRWTTLRARGAWLAYRSAASTDLT